MTLTVISRWKVPDVNESAKFAKVAKSIWLKNGAQDCRLSLVFTGPYTGQMIFATVFVDMAAFAKAWATVQSDAAWQKFQEDIREYNGTHGGGMEERDLLMGVDI